jgi:hypothetical protein
LLAAPRASLFFSVVAVAGLAIGAFAIGVLMLPHAGVLGDRQGEMTCLQIAFSNERAYSIIASFAPDAQAAMARLLVPGDMVFAWSYGLTLAGLVGLVVLRLDGRWRKWGAVAIWFPIAAALLDDVEDVFLYQTVQSVIANPDVLMSPMLPALAGTAAVLKYTALCVLTPAYSVGAVVRGLQIDRRFTAMIVYALLLMMIASLFARLAPQLPLCF